MGGKQHAEKEGDDVVPEMRGTASGTTSVQQKLAVLLQVIQNMVEKKPWRASAARF